MCLHFEGVQLEDPVVQAFRKASEEGLRGPVGIANRNGSGIEVSSGILTRQ